MGNKESVIPLENRLNMLYNYIIDKQLFMLYLKFNKLKILYAILNGWDENKL